MPFCVIFSQWHNVYEFDDSMNMYYLGLQAAKGYLIVGMEDKMFWTLSRWVVNLHKFLNLYMWSWGEACQRRIIVLLIFLACFAGDSITQRRGRWKNALPRSLSKIALSRWRVMRSVLCRRSPYLLSAGRLPWRSAWAGSCHRPVRLKFTHAGIVVAGQAFCHAITPCNP